MKFERLSRLRNDSVEDAGGWRRNAPKCLSALDVVRFGLTSAYKHGTAFTGARVDTSGYEMGYCALLKRLSVKKVTARRIKGLAQAGQGIRH